MKLRKELSLVDGIGALLDWDQQTYMPEAGGEWRAKQIEYIAVLRHKLLLDPALKKEAENESDAVNREGVLREIEKASKLPIDFVARKSKASSTAFQVWLKAKPQSEFALVAPYLEELVELTKEEADLRGYTKDPYDALLDQYEWGGEVQWVEPLLKELLFNVKVKPSSRKRFSMKVPEQQKLCLSVMEKLGLSLDSSRLDTSSHPFCTTIGYGDYRITTRYDENDLFSSLFSTLHEAGHCLYEAGLSKENKGLPRGEAVSLGVHESQSRFYENMIGRSKEFCGFLSALLNIDQEEIYQEVNYVEPSLIRVEADEVTYSVHVVIRFLLELALIKGELEVRDLPSAWNELYRKYLGVEPSCDREGVLQDVHWYSGAFGYFPTYVLGNIYGGMLLNKIKQDIRNFDGLIRSGDLLPINNWFKENIYKLGSELKPRELIESVTGEKISSRPFIQYLSSKHAFLKV